MISVVKTTDGYVSAYLEWEVVDENGQFKNGGEYCYVQNAWIHKDLRTRRTDMIDFMVKQMDAHSFTKNVKWVYWRAARDRNGKKLLEAEDRKPNTVKVSPSYTREQMLKKFKGV